MKQRFVKTLAAALLTSAIVPAGLSAAADAPATPPAAAGASLNYELTQQIRAAIKNASVTPTETGSQISVTVRLYNGGTASERVPEHDLRVRTEEGVTYTLFPSAENKTVLRPKEIIELVYSSSVDAKEIGKLAEVNFVGVDMYVYPRVESTLLSLPAGAVWYGLGESAPTKPEPTAWGETFRIPGVNSGLRYTPVNASVQSTAAGKAVVITLLAENPGSGRESIPSFRIDGVEGQKVYAGQASQNAANQLEAGEKTYLHYTIPLEQSETLSEFLVVSMDRYVGRSGATTISTGKLTIPWPAGQQTTRPSVRYSFGEPIAFDALSKVVDAQTEVALMEFHIHDNAEEGHKTAVAKFRMTNRSGSPAATPVFGTELANRQGVLYRGARQMSATMTMNPGLSYVVSYSFTLPQQEEDERFTLNLLDEKAAAPYSTTIAAVTVDRQEEAAGSAFSLYPFEIAVNDVQVSFMYQGGLYQHRINLDLTVNQLDNVVVDNSFSKLRFEVVDNAGRVIGTMDAGFTGPKKLISGKQTLEASSLTTDQFNYPFTVNLYEVFETESGTAKRFLKRVK